MAAKNDTDVRTRLQGAGLDLFLERGYERTTAAEIAKRAGVTERTFFRHFPDKREVLFDGEARLRALLTASIAEAPNGLGPLALLWRAFASTFPTLEGNRAFAEPRSDVIAATPVLQERELAKTAALADALAAALRARGVDELSAVLAAQVGMAAFAQVTLAWLRDPGTGLDERLDLAFRALRAVLTEADPAGAL